MKKFLKNSHMSYQVGFIPATILLCVCIIMWPREKVLPHFIIMELFVLFFSSVGCCKYLNSLGLYIDGQSIYYKGFRTKKISITQIGAIQVSKSVSRFRGSTTPFTDGSGNQLYTMFLLVNDELWERIERPVEIDDDLFRYRYGDYIICSSIYDQSTINYLLTLNPHIQIISSV